MLITSQRDSNGLMAETPLKRILLCTALFLAAIPAGRAAAHPTPKEVSAVTQPPLLSSYRRENMAEMIQSAVLSPTVIQGHASPWHPLPVAPAAAAVRPLAGVVPLSASSASVGIPVSFPGIQNTEEKTILESDHTPPDTMGAVGPTRVMSMANAGLVSVFDKQGNLLSRVSEAAFFDPGGIPTDDLTDAHVVFDPNSGRFIACIIQGFSVSQSFLIVAVSETSDPAGFWSKWAINTTIDQGFGQTQTFMDYPQLGVDQSGVYITGNMFDTAGNFQHSKLWVIPKAQLLVGSPTITWTEFSNIVLSTLVPCLTYGQPSGEFFVTAESGSSLRIEEVTGAATTPTLSQLGSVTVPGFSEPVDAPQPGTSNLISNGDSRILGAVFRNGSLWCDHTVGSNGRSEARWYQISVTGAPSLVQSGDIANAQRSYYFPSIAVNHNNDVVIGFSGSSPDKFAGGYVTAHMASDPAGVTATPIPVKGGEGDYFKTLGGNENRWGDYSATCVDPADDTAFWTVQEYAGLFANNWGTWWAKVSLGLARPTIPSQLTGVAGNGQVNLAWTGVAAAVGYNIKRSTTSGGPYVLAGTSATTDFTDSSLTNGVPLFYVVTSVDGSGNESSASNEISVTPSIISAPESFQAVGQNSQVLLSWADVPGAVSYKVKTASTATGPFATLGSVPNTAVSITQLTDGVQTFYRVSAVDGAGHESANSAVAAATPIAPPAAPANFTTSVLPGQVSLQWLSSTGATSYHVKRGSVSGGPYQIVGSVVNPTALDTSLTTGLRYFYRISALNAGGESANSVEVNQTLSPPPSLLGLSILPASVVGGSTSTGTVTLTVPALAGGVQVSLSSSAQAATVLQTITVPAGATSATFTINTTPVAANTPVSITAISGGVTKSIGLTVTAPVVTAVSVNPASVSAGVTSVGAVTLNGAAPTGGFQVSLTSSSAAASVPTTVTVAAGAKTSNFTVSTSGTVTVQTTVTITAKTGVTSKTTTLTVVPVVVPSAVSSLTFNPTMVPGGGSSTGTVTLTAGAPVSGLVVTLSSNSGSAVAPTSVTVPAGATTATFTLTTSSVQSDVVATITAQGGGGTASSTLSIQVNVDHPADLNDDSSISVSEISAYASAFLKGQTWPRGPNPIPLNFVTRAAQIFLTGEIYHFDPTSNPPWVAGPALAGAAAGNSSTQSLGSLTARVSGDAVARSVASYSPGVQVPITLAVHPNSSAHAFGIEEVLPSGWSPTYIGDGGQYDSKSRTIRWVIFGSAPQALHYAAESSATVAGPAAFQGRVSFDGKSSAIGGVRVLQAVGSGNTKRSTSPLPSKHSPSGIQFMGYTR